MIIEPYLTGSHRLWAEGLMQHSRHKTRLLSLKGQFWKWRMHGGAVTLARRFLSSPRPDVILCTDMLDLTTFLALTRNQTSDVPVVLYFHENQISYPWSHDDRDRKLNRDRHYGFINYTSAMAANQIWFNSDYHRSRFLSDLEAFLKHYPDHRELKSVDSLAAKSQVVYPGLDLQFFDRLKNKNTTRTGPPVILWNHRWEYDKNPDEFFSVLCQVQSLGFDFRLVILGENFSSQPSSFHKAIELLSDKILYKGFVQDRNEYACWLYQSDILPVTSIQEFFGISVVEAIYCGCYPLLPRRLTYSELLAHHADDRYFYDDQHDLSRRLCDLLNHPDQLDSGNEFADIVFRFDWQNIISHYDKNIDGLIDIVR